jgi:hypothetical protein
MKHCIEWAGYQGTWKRRSIKRKQRSEGKKTEWSQCRQTNDAEPASFKIENSMNISTFPSTIQQCNLMFQHQTTVLKCLKKFLPYTQMINRKVSTGHHRKHLVIQTQDWSQKDLAHICI